jgi:hypothetical protein
MSEEIELLNFLYNRFNARDMEAVLAALHEDVVWANGGRSRAGARRRAQLLDPPMGCG